MRIEINAVAVTYAAISVCLYLNLDIIGYLLSPLLDAQSSPQYTFNYAAIDLGGPFPRATGNIQGHNERVEQSANMIILSHAHAQASGNENLINQYYVLLSKWGDYLVNNALSPTDQTTSSSDNIGSTNQTNLILKGIIGIRAMSEISSLTGHSDDFTKYKAKADQYYKFWENLAISDRIDLTYGGDSGLIYNLYADKLLGLNVVDDSVYALQTSFYKICFSQQQYGVPLDTANFSLSRTDWMLFAATTTTDTQVRDNMIKQVYNYAASNLSDNPFPLVYDPSNGKMISGLNSPAQGAIFAPLALTVNKNINTSNLDPNSGGGAVKKPSSTGAIVGGVVGGVAAISISIACILLYRRRQQKKTASRFETGDMSQALRYRNHSNVIPTPFRVPGPQSDIIVQNPSPRNKTDKSGPALKIFSSMRPYVGETTGVERSNDTDGEALREELSRLRMDIEILREETAPPSYVS